jgi:integrase
VLYAAYVLVLVLGLRKGNDSGSPGRRSTSTKPSCTSASKAGVPKITVHGTRKTCGSLLAALDIHPRVAMQILRHSKIAVTMEIYTEIPSAATRDALRKLGRWLDT